VAMSQENVELVRRAIAAFNAREVETLVSLCDPECDFLPFRAQLEGLIYRGHEGMRQFMRDIEEDWETYRIDASEFRERGDRVAALGQVTAQGRGTGMHIESTAGFVFEVRDGLAMSIVSHSDASAALAELGLT
jgi:ketosteroid isomerase-like protein